MNKKEKEQLVIKLHQENETIRQIAEIVHMSFKDIGSIIRKAEGDYDNTKLILNHKSKATQALYLFEKGKRPIDVAIELDIPYSEVVELQQEYWALKELYDLAFLYMEVKDDLSSFIELYRLMKQKKMLSKKHILKFIRYAIDDLPTLENRFQNLSGAALDLQIQKKQLQDEITKLSSNIFQLRKLQKWYNMDIDQMKQILSNLDRQLNQRVCALEEKQTGNGSQNGI